MRLAILFSLILLTGLMLGCSSDSDIKTEVTDESAEAESRLVGAAEEWATPESPDDLLAQLKRAIINEDSEAMRSLYYKLESIEAVAKEQDQQRDNVQKVFDDHKEFIMTRIVIKPLEKPLANRLLRRKLYGVPMTMTPDPTHTIDIEYRHPLVGTGGRTSGFWAGSQDGVWYLSTMQPDE